MYIYSDFKTKNFLVRNSSVPKGMEFLGENCLKQTLCLKKSILKKNQFLDNYNSFCNKKEKSTTSAKINTADFSEKHGKLIKNTSAHNFNNNNYGYSNWVNGIKAFSSKICDKKWKINQFTMKTKKITDDNSKTKYNNSSLKIEKYNPKMDIDDVNSNMIELNNNFSINSMPKNILIKNRISYKKFSNSPNINKELNNNQIKSQYIDQKSSIIKDIVPLKIKRKSINSKQSLKNSSDITKIVFSKINTNEITKTSMNSSNHSLNEEKKEEIMKYISHRNHSPHKDLIFQLQAKSARIKKQSNESEIFEINSSVKKIKNNLYCNQINPTGKPHLEYIDKKLKSMKDKILLMKSVCDYVYPKIVLKKAEEITNRHKRMRIRNQLINIQNAHSPEENFQDNFPLQIKNFSLKNSSACMKEILYKTHRTVSNKTFYTHRSHQIKGFRQRNNSIVSEVTPIKIQSFN